MPAFDIFGVAGSAMSAQRVRLNTVASNMANANTVSPTPEDAYRARSPVFKAFYEGQRQDATTVGVRVTEVMESQNPVQRQHAPGHPEANEDGYIYRSNVNVTEEMANMISASRSYQNSVQVLETSKELMLRTLNLGKG